MERRASDIVSNLAKEGQEAFFFDPLNTLGLPGGGPGPPANSREAALMRIAGDRFFRPRFDA